MRNGCVRNLVFVLSVIAPKLICAADDPCKAITERLVGRAWDQAQREKLSAELKANPALGDLFRAIGNAGYTTTAFNRTDPEIAQRIVSPVYTIQLAVDEIVNQMRAGLCWDWSSGNTIQLQLGLPFQFSPTYTYFYHLALQADRYLMDIAKAPIDEKTKVVDWEKIKPLNIQDGGWDEQYGDLATAFGIVPMSAMPVNMETLNSEQLLHGVNRYTARITQQMIAVKEDGASRGWKQETIDRKLAQIREQGMSHIYRILVKHLGMPPEKFSLTIPVEQKVLPDKNAPRLVITKTVTKEFTPHTFRDAVGYKPEDYVIIALNDERAPGYYEEKQSDDYPSSPNDPEGIRGARTLNLGNHKKGINALKAIIINSLQKGIPVRFSADVDEEVEHETGIMHPRVFSNASNVPEGQAFEEADRVTLMRLGIASANHALMISGVYIPDSPSTKMWFKVPNTWGTAAGRNGVYDMSEDWLHNVYSIVVPKNVLSKELLDILATEPTQIDENFWDDHTGKK